MTRKFIPLLILLALASGIAAAHAMGLGALGYRFGGLGAIGNKKAAVVVGCASPTAPNGVVDLSQCSNAFYAAVIF